MSQNEPSGCLFAVLKLFGIQPSATPVNSLPYRKRDFLLTKAERSFYGVLQLVAQDQYLIFAKVRIADLLYIPSGTENRQSHFNRIQAKHIDFVLCEKATVRPLIAIELDDSSHKRRDRKDRDSFVDDALHAAALPLIRVPAGRTYRPEELRQLISTVVT